jgi:uncharacterized lipoprotein YehR (DUF1307 family)
MSLLNKIIMLVFLSVFSVSTFASACGSEKASKNENVSINGVKKEGTNFQTTNKLVLAATSDSSAGSTSSSKKRPR